MEILLSTLLDLTIESISMSHGAYLVNHQGDRKYFAGITQYTSLEHLILLKLLVEYYFQEEEVIILWNPAPQYKSKIREEFTRFTLEFYVQYKKRRKRRLLGYLRELREYLPYFLYCMRRDWYEIPSLDPDILIRENTYIGEPLLLLSKNLWLGEKRSSFLQGPLKEDTFWNSLISSIYPLKYSNNFSVSQVSLVDNSIWTILTAPGDEHEILKRDLRLFTVSKKLEEIFAERAEEFSSSLYQ